MANETDRPNFVLLIGDDTGPHLGCYGDRAAITPNLDRLAAEGVRLTNAFTHGPVCGTSRSGLVTGMYPTSIGTHHMRSTLLRPPPMFTTYLRQAGYHVSWPHKTDFNFAVPDGSFTDTADWSAKLPPEPFFAFRHLGQTHESMIRADDDVRAHNTRRLTDRQRRDPASVTVPPFLPDVPEVRRDLARHHENVTALDHEVGDVLDLVDRSGVRDRTVVIFTSDHGPGLPRHKRCVYDSGTHQSFIVRWPGHVGSGTTRDDLVGFVDIAPTLLALAGLPVPPEMQGQVFLGERTATDARPFVFAARDRMDEAFDRVRSVRGRRFRYVRNFRPDLPYAQRIAYMELMPTTQVYRRMNAAGELNATQRAFFASRKPKEELYDCLADPFETVNLAADPLHAATLRDMRAALQDWQNRFGDLGEVPERDLIRRGLVADRLDEYARNIEPLPAPLQPAGGPWDVEGRPMRH